MVRFLIFVEVLDVIGSDIARPLHIEQVCIIGLKHSETGGLARVDYSVVNMRRVRDAEWHEEVLDLLASIHPDPIGHSLDANIGWILEEGHWRTSFKYWLQKSDLIGMRLKDAVRQASLFFLDEFLIERVLDKESFDFLLSKDQWIVALDILI